jgi:hypothetical protein
VGWLAFFLGALALLHRFGRLGSAATAEAAGGAIGKWVFDVTAGLFGQALGILLLLLLVLGGAAAGLGVPFHYYRTAIRVLKRTATDLSRLLRRWAPLAVRFFRFAVAAGSAVQEQLWRGSAAVRAAIGRCWLATLDAAAALRERLSRPAASGDETPGPAFAEAVAARPGPGVARGASAKPASAKNGGDREARAVAQPSANGEGWQLPPLALLQPGAEPEASPMDDEERLKNLERTIEKTLADFGVPVRVVERRPGPTVTQFGLEPQFHERRARDGTILRREKVKVREITSRANDLALALAARSIRIEAPVPGRPFVGVEVPNQATSVVTLRSELESRAFQRALAKYALPIVLGRDVSGEVVTATWRACPTSSSPGRPDPASPCASTRSSPRC